MFGGAIDAWDCGCCVSNYYVQKFDIYDLQISAYDVIWLQCQRRGGKNSYITNPSKPSSQHHKVVGMIGTKRQKIAMEQV